MTATKYNMKYFILVIGIFLFGMNNDCYAELYKGDSCKIRSTGKSGTCELLGKCLIVLENIRKGKRDHISCGFLGNEPIVCCPINEIQMTKKSDNILPPPTPPPSSSRISAQKCFEYKEEIFEKHEIITIIGSKPHVQFSRHCAMDSIPLIVGGVVTNIGEFPHMASLGYSTISGIQWLCGGSLISNQFILTAAHCLRLSNGNVTLVKLGAHKLLSNSNANDKNNNEEENHSIDVEIAEIYLHKKYRTNSRYNDIGLIRLKQIITFNPYIRPICLPELTPPPPPTPPNDHNHRRTMLIGTGWGDQSYTGIKSNVLRKVTLELFDYEECQAQLKTFNDRKLPNGIENKTQLCAGSHTQVKDTCQGDSGGPLQKQHDSYDCMYTIVGLVSFGKGCGTINSPGVYTRISAYLEWIEQIVWP